MGLLNSRLGTSFSPNNTVLVSRRPFENYCIFTKQIFSSNWAVLDFQLIWQRLSLSPRACNDKKMLIHGYNNYHFLTIINYPAISSFTYLAQM